MNLKDTVMVYNYLFFNKGLWRIEQMALMLCQHYWQLNWNTVYLCIYFMLLVSVKNKCGWWTIIGSGVPKGVCVWGGCNTPPLFRWLSVFDEISSVNIALLIPVGKASIPFASVFIFITSVFNEAYSVNFSRRMSVGKARYSHP